MPSYEKTPINTTQLPEFQAWTDVFGMVQNNPNGDSTDNGILYTAHMVAGMRLKDILTPEERDRINKVITNNYVQPGLLSRYPGYVNYEAHDDILGAVSADVLMNPDRPITKAIYNYGKTTYCDGIDDKDPDQNTVNQNSKVYGLLTKIFGKVRWVWNNVYPGKFHVFSWLGRRFEVLATLQMAAGERVNLLYWLFWALTMLQLQWFPNKTYHDGYILRFHSALACKGYGKLTDMVCDRLRAVIKRDFGDVGNLLSLYFNDPTHPLVKLMSGIS